MVSPNQGFVCCKRTAISLECNQRKHKKLFLLCGTKFQFLFFVFGAIFHHFILFENTFYLQASEKETIPKDDKKEDEPSKDTNGEKNGDTVETVSVPAGEKQKLSLGEIAAIDGEIAKAKTEQLQVLHNVRLFTVL